VHNSHADGPEQHVSSPSAVDRQLECHRPATSEAHRDEDTHRQVLNPAQRERQALRRCVIQPLGVVDRDEHRPRRRQVPHERQHGGVDRATGRARSGFGPQQCYVERVPLDRSEHVERLVWHRVEQISESGERQRPLRLAWPDREHDQPACPRLTRSPPPDRGLPDAGRAGERYGRQSGWQPAEERIDLSKLAVPPKRRVRVHDIHGAIDAFARVPSGAAWSPVALSSSRVVAQFGYETGDRH